MPITLGLKYQRENRKCSESLVAVPIYLNGIFGMSLLIIDVESNTNKTVL